MPAHQPLRLPLLQIIAINLPKDEIEGLKAMFHSIDTDKRWAARWTAATMTLPACPACQCTDALCPRLCQR